MAARGDKKMLAAKEDDGPLKDHHLVAQQLYNIKYLDGGRARDTDGLAKETQSNCEE